MINASKAEYIALIISIVVSGITMFTVVFKSGQIVERVENTSESVEQIDIKLQNINKKVNTVSESNERLSGYVQAIMSSIRTSQVTRSSPEFTTSSTNQAIK